MFMNFGLAPKIATNMALFHAENNAWCVVADINEADPDRIPFLFTRNLSVSNLAELNGKISDHLSEGAPFGRKTVIVICKDGSPFALNPDLPWSNFFGVAIFTNRILRP